MGITAYYNTFKYKNMYKNILTGINKEEVLTRPPHQNNPIFALLSPLNALTGEIIRRRWESIVARGING